MVQAVMRAMGSDGERQVKPCSLTHRSPPVARFRRSAAGELGTPVPEVGQEVIS